MSNKKRFASHVLYRDVLDGLPRVARAGEGLAAGGVHGAPTSFLNWRPGSQALRVGGVVETLLSVRGRRVEKCWSDRDDAHHRHLVGCPFRSRTAAMSGWG